MDLQAVIFDYGEVLSDLPDTQRHSNLVSIAGIAEEGFDKSYWAHRLEYDGDLRGVLDDVVVGQDMTAVVVNESRTDTFHTATELFFLRATLTRALRHEPAEHLFEFLGQFSLRAAREGHPLAVAAHVRNAALAFDADLNQLLADDLIGAVTRHAAAPRSEVPKILSNSKRHRPSPELPAGLCGINRR